MSFSVCVPNFNYGRYLGDTISSALAQGDLLEDLVVADNASTDDSVEVIRSFDDHRVRLVENPCNVGFAANLDRAVAPSRGDWVLLLSSDDLMAPEALRTYEKVRLWAQERWGGRGVICSTTDVIDGTGRRIGRRIPHPWLWGPADIDPMLSAEVGAPVYHKPPDEILRISLQRMRNPFYFVSVAYPRSSWEEVGGYRSGRMINPDKGFHWRVLAAVDWVVCIDLPLFSYRIHASNQKAIQSREASLRLLVDEYAYSLEVPEDLLERASMARDDLAQAFVREDIVRRGLGALAEGGSGEARRVWRFGAATYPGLARRSAGMWALRAACALGPVGTAVARKAYGPARRVSLGEPQTQLQAEPASV